MKEYEALVIIEPGLDDNEVEKALTEIDQFISSEGGKLTQKELQGKKVLAYTIGGHRDGYYALLRFGLSGAGVKKFEKKMRSNTSVVRYLLVTGK